MLKDIIEERQKKARENYRLAEQQWEFSPTDLDKEIAETAQIVAREVLSKIHEFNEAQLKFYQKTASTNEFAHGRVMQAEDMKFHLQSLEERLESNQ
jgi:hypothetical protein